MHRVRVLHLHNALGGGGIESFIAAVAPVLEPSFDMHLFSLRAEKAYEGPLFPTRDHEAWLDHGKLRTTVALCRHIQDWEPDIIHAHSPYNLAFGALSSALSGNRARLILHWHLGAPAEGAAPARGAVLARLQSRLMNHAACVIACSEAAASHNSSRHTVPRDRIRVLYNPVDTASYAGRAECGQLKARIGADEAHLLGVCLGRLDVCVKGLDILCDAVRLLPTELPVRVAIVGPGDLDVVRRQLDPPEGVTLMGPVDREEVPALLRSCDFCLQPSRTEALGISILEAMAAGLPVIASRVGGIPEAVVDGETGVLVPPEDPQALADAIQWMVEHPVERAEMGKRGRERAMLFDVHTIAAQLEQIYREVLDG